MLAASTRPSSTTASMLRSSHSPRASPVPASVTDQADDRLPEPVELAAYFVASEALTNAAKYAQADPHRRLGARVAHPRTAR